MGKRKAKNNSVTKNNEIIVKKSCLKKRETPIVEPDDDESTGQAVIEILSDDNLAKIFSYLPIKKRLDMEKGTYKF